MQHNKHNKHNKKLDDAIIKLLKNEVNISNENIHTIINLDNRYSLFFKNNYGSYNDEYSSWYSIITSIKPKKFKNLSYDGISVTEDAKYKYVYYVFYNDHMNRSTKKYQKLCKKLGLPIDDYLQWMISCSSIRNQHTTEYEIFTSIVPEDIQSDRSGKVMKDIWYKMITYDIKDWQLIRESIIKYPDLLLYKRIFESIYNENSYHMIINDDFIKVISTDFDKWYTLLDLAKKNIMRYKILIDHGLVEDCYIRDIFNSYKFRWASYETEDFLRDYPQIRKMYNTSSYEEFIKVSCDHHLLPEHLRTVDDKNILDDWIKKAKKDIRWLRIFESNHKRVKLEELKKEEFKLRDYNLSEYIDKLKRDEKNEKNRNNN